MNRRASPNISELDPLYIEAVLEAKRPSTIYLAGPVGRAKGKRITEGKAYSEEVLLSRPAIPDS